MPILVEVLSRAEGQKGKVIIGRVAAGSSIVLGGLTTGEDAAESRIVVTCNQGDNGGFVYGVPAGEQGPIDHTTDVQDPATEEHVLDFIIPEEPAVVDVTSAPSSTFPAGQAARLILSHYPAIDGQY